jgi:hypothetical protein
LKGYRTYITAIALALIGFAGFIDPAAAAYVGQLTGMDATTILMICGLVMAGLRKITAQE